MRKSSNSGTPSVILAALSISSGSETLCFRVIELYYALDAAPMRCWFLAGSEPPLASLFVDIRFSVALGWWYRSVLWRSDFWSLRESGFLLVELMMAWLDL